MRFCTVPLVGMPEMPPPFLVPYRSGGTFSPGMTSPLERVLRRFATENLRLSCRQLHCLAEALSMQATPVQVYAAAFLIKHGFYYTAMKIALEERKVLRSILEEMRLIVMQNYGSVVQNEPELCQLGCRAS